MLFGLLSLCLHAYMISHMGHNRKCCIITSDRTPQPAHTHTHTHTHRNKMFLGIRSLHNRENTPLSPQMRHCLTHTHTHTHTLMLEHFNVNNESSPQRLKELQFLGVNGSPASGQFNWKQFVSTSKVVSPVCWLDSVTTMGSFVTAQCVGSRCVCLRQRWRLRPPGLTCLLMRTALVEALSCPLCSLLVHSQHTYILHWRQ